jgi:hypothetical protein
VQRRGSKLWIPKGRFVKVHPPPVFCRKSTEVIENKGSGREKERKERKRVRKRKEAKEIEELKGEDPASFLRDNTGNANVDPLYLSIVNISSRF